VTILLVLSAPLAVILTFALVFSGLALGLVGLVCAIEQLLAGGERLAALLRRSQPLRRVSGSGQAAVAKRTDAQLAA
jgi:hypothetical protein